MSRGENDLCELGGHIEDAAELLRRASQIALRLTGSDEKDDPGWPAMAALVDRLDALNTALTELPGAEISDAITQAAAYLDDLSDRADGISY